MASAGIQPFLEALDEPTLVLEGRVIRFANAAARKLFGVGIEGGDVRLAIRHPEALEHILPGEPGDVDITGIGQFGRPWTLSIRRIDEQTLLLRLIDRSAAIAAEKMRVDFVANASHELRTPLATIIGYSETLADEADLEPAIRLTFGSTIRSEAQRMLRIIEDLMSLSRIEAGRFVAPSGHVSIGEVVSQAIENAVRIAGSAQCSIQVDVEEGLPRVLGDQSQLAQLLDNLLSNAIRYGCQSGGCAVRVAASADDGFIRLSVTDNGPGIPREHLRRVTERFYRVDAARSRESGGTGLGLAIAKHIVERHRGTLDIRSTLGEGTEVVVRLPAPR
ncbi:ATP-binding protein [Sphingomonas sp.]|uniref:sensor histidine kinase n=1 Tax=Sphingomonas sp. TaxID=28214 RepID=UPI0017A34F14|nr:ATP-binding protein [Sphingomonas sp.]MBA3511813.1 ATPase [Sphingomonas sp.]